MLKKIVHKIARYIYFVGYNYFNSKEYCTVKFESNCNIGKNTFFYSPTKIMNNSGKKELINIGDYTNIRGELVSQNENAKISIGNYCYIGEGTKIWAMKSIIIGNNVLIAHGVNIIDNNSHSLNHEERKWDYLEQFSIQKNNNFSAESKEIIIKDNVWIGLNCIILKGSIINEGSIIAAGSVVNREIPAFTLWAGNPIKFIKNVS